MTKLPSTFCLLLTVASTLTCKNAWSQRDGDSSQTEKLIDVKVNPEQWAAFQKWVASQKNAKKSPVAGKKTKEEETAVSATKASTEPESLGKKIAKQISIRKSFLSTDDEAEPAKLNWTNTRGESPFYTLDLAVLLHPTTDVNDRPRPLFDSEYTFSGGSRLDWNLKPTFEAHISTEMGSEQDSLSYRLPLTLTFSPRHFENVDGLTVAVANKNAFVQGHRLIISPVYETDRVNSTETIGGDIFYTPTIVKSLAIGKEAVLGPFSFRWRPYIGFEGGHVIDDGGDLALLNQSEFARLSLKLHAELWLKIFDSDQLVVASDYYFRQSFTGDTPAYNYVEVSPILYLDKEHFLSTGLTYKRGKSTPKFDDVDSLSVWLGLKF
jgi:hypothetical protein